MFLFFRAMGVTKPVRTQSASSASSNERLSDREIMECILGVDTSGTVSVEVPLDHLRSLCGADGTQGWTPGTTNVWYTPRGDGDCAWVILPKAPSGRVTGFGVGDTVQLHTPSHTFACVVVEQHQTGVHSKVRWPPPSSGEGRDSKTDRSNRSAWCTIVPFQARPIRITLTPSVAEHAVLAPCRYERRHKATVQALSLIHI